MPQPGFRVMLANRRPLLFSSSGVAKLVSSTVPLPPRIFSRYSVLNSDAFISIVDAVNGVDITLDEDVNIEMQGGELLSLEKGDNRLFGREALYFVRHRKSYADADLGRIGAQSVFVRAFLKKLSGLDTIAVLNLYKITLDKVVIDASLNMLSSIDGIIKSLRYKDVSFYVLPGEPIILNKVSYYEINRAEADKMLSIFGGRCSSNDGDFIY